MGVLFITATVAGFASAIFLGPVLETSNFLAEVSANELSWIIGVLFVFIMAVAGASIAVPMYPILKKHNESMALGSVGFRIIEGAIFSVGVICFLALVPLSRAFEQAGSPASSYYQTLGELLVFGQSFGMVIGGLAFSIGALMYYYIFYQSKLIPRWLSVFGLIAVTLGIVQYFLTFFSASVPSSDIEILHIPIFLQEMVLAVWLIVKGFDSSGE